MRKRTSCASAVPSEREREQRRGRLQARHGVRQLEEGEGQEDQAPDEHRAGGEHRPGGAGDSAAGRTRPDAAYESDEATTASAPAIAHQPPCGLIPVTTATPTIPIASPAARVPFSRSCGRKRSTMQRVEDRHGGLDDRGEAGVDVLLAPGDQPERQRCVERAEDEAVAPGAAQLARPRGCGRAARRRSRRGRLAATSVRNAIIGAGAISSTATLMKRYDAPQTAARRSSIGQ